MDVIGAVFVAASVAVAALVNGNDTVILIDPRVRRTAVGEVRATPRA